MCGFTGYVTRNSNYSEKEMLEDLLQMNNSIIHRGPDSGGTWINAERGIALGHRRLAIVDLTPEGHQPMYSNSGRYVIVFNGEIYNFQKLKEKIIAYSPEYASKFRGNSDTEVILASIELFGIEKAVDSFIGMFAFSIFDLKENKLHLVRDRVGEKPLYYGWNNNHFLFGSELKSIVAHPHCHKEINRNALTLYLRHNYIPAPYSIYEGINKLEPGKHLILDLNSYKEEIRTYWSFENIITQGIYSKNNKSEDDILEELEWLIKDSVKQQMLADVPLGAFLSGGIDSSTIVALMQQQSSKPVKTFSMGFNEDAYNEAQYAKEVARYLGTDHTEMYVTPQEALNVIPKLPVLYDEPFSDSSQIPTFLVSQLAKQHVTVSLSGDAGDELFGGYSRYQLGANSWGKLGRIPEVLRTGGATALKGISVDNWNRYFNWLSPMLAKTGRRGAVGDKMHKIAEVIGVKDFDEFYQRLISHWKNPDEIIINGKEPNYAFTDLNRKLKLENPHQNMMYLDSITYLPDDILVKVDRAAMGVSLETRVPFLDHRIIEFAWKMPNSMKIREGTGKWALRQVLYKHVPQNLIDRPKKGFGVPIDQWLRGPLKEWCEYLLDGKRLNDQGILNPEPILQKWKEHKEGTRDWHYYLWDILMLQAWIEQNNIK
ncbi:asparagine synthase (glutamine-hydrolyzing) [Bacillus cereus]|uniref:asparagine synthase (glutamine-hydrolyzing) n=1 Tax=Bacillus cereus TaxID=1396 RepID=UPI000BFCAEAE|nr:asparagine synthase (glutamine-hydrolyzing) [Bacillus cereus]PGM73300.1 asparagine synthase (glutamine-hydrolyzing) [Bacillus cereus]PGN14715.1 asparagine synthase (glutamine-hydrolyzing) [Bacillus cereus]